MPGNCLETPSTLPGNCLETVTQRARQLPRNSIVLKHQPRMSVHYLRLDKPKPHTKIELKLYGNIIIKFFFFWKVIMSCFQHLNSVYIHPREIFQVLLHILTAPIPSCIISYIIYYHIYLVTDCTSLWAVLLIFFVHSAPRWFFIPDITTITSKLSVEI